MSDTGQIRRRRQGHGQALQQENISPTIKPAWTTSYEPPAYEPSTDQPPAYDPAASQPAVPLGESSTQQSKKERRQKLDNTAGPVVKDTVTTSTTANEPSAFLPSGLQPAIPHTEQPLGNIAEASSVKDIPTSPQKPAKYDPGTPLPFCQACQEARNSPQFVDRVASAMRLLKCSACLCEHPALLFSASQRDAPDPSRVCIGHQGHYTLCPHQKIRFSDVQQFNELFPQSQHQELVQRCVEPSCPCHRARIRYSGTNGAAQLLITWSASLSPLQTMFLPEGKDSFAHQCVAKLNEIHNECPAIFCPHKRVNFDRLVQVEKMKVYGEDTTFILSCRICGHTIRNLLKPLENDEPIQFSDFIKWRRGLHTGASKYNWISALDPESYDLYSDMEMKHIAWCDDRNCATTFGLIQWYKLLDEVLLGGESQRKLYTDHTKFSLSVLDAVVAFHMRATLGLPNN